MRLLSYICIWMPIYVNFKNTSTYVAYYATIFYINVFPIFYNQLKKKKKKIFFFKKKNCLDKK